MIFIRLDVPRQARLDCPSLMHHVIARGIERRIIFSSREDYHDFLGSMAYCVEKDGNQVLAWALMPNHFHLLIRSGTKGLVPFMRRLMTGYAVRFNIRHKRFGHLFQNRYKSIVCEEETYLLELVRYIHLNPMRGGLVRTLDQLAKYPYSGHSALVGNIKRPWQETEDILERFGGNFKTARRKYIEFVQMGVGMKSRTDLLGGGLVRSLGGMGRAMQARREEDRQLSDARILGDGKFVEKVLRAAEKRDRQRLQFKSKKIDLRWAAREAARVMGVEERDLFLKGRKEAVSAAKAIYIYMGTEYFGKSRQEMADMTRMSGPAATKAKERGNELFTHSSLADKLKSYLVTNVP